MKSPATLLPLGLGLALGAACVLALRLASPAASPATPSRAHADPSPPGLKPLSSLLVSPRLSPADADVALDAYLALPPLSATAPEPEIAERAVRLRALLTLLPVPDFGRLLTLTADRIGDAEARLRRVAFAAWIELDAPAGARWAADLEPGDAIDKRTRQRFATDAALVWAAADFDAAYAWAAAVPDPALGDPLARALLARLIGTDPARALALARARSETFFTAARLELFNAWQKVDPGAAILTLGSSVLEPGMNADNWYLTQGLAAWGRTDPAATLDWILAQTQLSVTDNRELLRRVASRAGHEGEAATLAESLRHHPGLNNGPELLGWLLNSWAEQTPQAALRWIDSLPDPAERVALLTGALNMWSSHRPETNLPVALHLPVGPDRTQKINTILERWAAIDPEAPLAWLRAQNDPSLAHLAEEGRGEV